MILNIYATENGKSPSGGLHKTPKLMKSQFGGAMKPDAQTLDASRNNNSLQEDYKTDNDKPQSSNSKSKFGQNMQTLPPPDSKGNTPANPQGF